MKARGTRYVVFEPGNIKVTNSQSKLRRKGIKYIRN